MSSALSIKSTGSCAEPVLQQVLYSFAAHEKERGGDAPGQSVSHGRSRRFASKAEEGRAALAMAAELRSLRAFFAHADADDTGRVSVAQWNAAATLPTLSAEMQGALVSPGGTEIEYQRFVAASVSTRYVFYHQDLFKDAFLEFTGGREELTPDCVVERCGVDAAVAAEWVRVMDLSGSDSVTFAEFYAFASAQFNNAHTISAMVPEFLYAEPEAATAPAALAPPPPTAECFPCTVCGGVGSEHEAWCPTCSFSPKRGSSSLRKASSIRLSPNARLDRSPPHLTAPKTCVSGSARPSSRSSRGCSATRLSSKCSTTRATRARRPRSSSPCCSECAAMADAYMSPTVRGRVRAQ